MVTVVRTSLTSTANWRATVSVNDNAYVLEAKAIEKFRMKLVTLQFRHSADGYIVENCENQLKILKLTNSKVSVTLLHKYMRIV
jgi:hypothetical protein